MTLVTSLKSLRLIPGMRHVTFACGHHMLMTDKNPLLEVGSDLVCEACVRGERTILSVTPAWSMSGPARHVNIRFECGHDTQTVPLKEPFTVENVREIVGTTMQCRGCNPVK